MLRPLEPTTPGHVATDIARASTSTVASLIAARAKLFPNRVAIQTAERGWTYAELDERARRLASVLGDHGIRRGRRIAVLSENRAEYLEVFVAAAMLGATVGCQNWRLAPTEVAHCLNLIEPSLVIASPRHRSKLRDAGSVHPELLLGSDYEAALSAAAPIEGLPDVDPEDALLILYTSGTTGLPKGATISHRAELARNLVIRAEFGIEPEDSFVAWSPLYHMGATDPALGTLMVGGKVIVIDGFDATQLAQIVASESIGWLLLMPGMVSRFAGVLKDNGIRPKSVKVCGVMADLVPPHEIAEITRLLDAPYANTFGATETGCPPCSSNLLPVGVPPERLSKQQSSFCEVRLVDAKDRDVRDGEPGELCMRGPTLFSGYFRAEEVNRHDFRGGWFHMGDVFVRNPDGTLDFVDRVKYLIKSGGENIYPAEIERVLLSEPRVADAAVVRRKDPKWGEVPVAFVARRDERLTAAELHRLCRAQLAGYKQPKGIHFIAFEDFPRSASGKIQRHELEKRLDLEETPS